MARIGFKITCRGQSLRSAQRFISELRGLEQTAELLYS